MPKSFLFLRLRALLLLGLTLGWAGCKEDPCEGKDCGPFGFCVEIAEEGRCECEEGYEKDSDELCTVYDMSHFAGDFTASEQCTDLLTNTVLLPSTYVISLARATTTDFRITNFGNIPCFSGPLRVDATKDRNNFALRTGLYCRDVVNQTEYAISGNGLIDADGIQFLYELSLTQFGTVTQNNRCSVTLRKN